MTEAFDLENLATRICESAGKAFMQAMNLAFSYAEFDTWFRATAAVLLEAENAESKPWEQLAQAAHNAANGAKLRWLELTPRTQLAWQALARHVVTLAAQLEEGELSDEALETLEAGWAAWVEKRLGGTK